MWPVLGAKYSQDIVISWAINTSLDPDGPFTCTDVKNTEEHIYEVQYTSWIYPQYTQLCLALC